MSARLRVSGGRAARPIPTAYRKRPSFGVPRPSGAPSVRCFAPAGRSHFIAGLAAHSSRAAADSVRTSNSGPPNPRLYPSTGSKPSNHSPPISRQPLTRHTHHQRRLFGTTRVAMVANKLDGTAIAKSIRERLGTEIAEKQKVNPRYRPALKIIQV